MLVEQVAQQRRTDGADDDAARLQRDADKLERIVGELRSLIEAEPEPSVD